MPGRKPENTAKETLMAAITITTDNAQAQRLATALGRKLDYRNEATGAPRDATGAEIKAYVVDMLRAVVHEYEAEQLRIQSSLSAFTPA